MGEAQSQNVSEPRDDLPPTSRVRVARRAICLSLAVLVGIVGIWWVSNSWRYWVAERIVIDLSQDGKNSGIELPPSRSELEWNAADRRRLALCTVILPGGRRYTHLVGSLLVGHKDGTTYWIRLSFVKDRQAVVIQQLRDILREFDLPTAEFDKWDREYREKGYPPMAKYEHLYKTDWGRIILRTAPSYTKNYPWTLDTTFSITPEDVFTGTRN